MMTLGKKDNHWTSRNTKLFLQVLSRSFFDNDLSHLLQEKGASHQPLLDTITIEHDLDSLLFWSIAIRSWVSRVNHHCLASHLGRSIVHVFENASVWNGLDVWTRCANGREDIRTFPMEWFWERLFGGDVVSRDRTSFAILIGLDTFPKTLAQGRWSISIDLIDDLSFVTLFASQFASFQT